MQREADSDGYWRVIAEIAMQLRSWSRLQWRGGTGSSTTSWGMLLTVPTPGHLEGGDGPVPIRGVEWLQLSTVRLLGGVAGRPLTQRDIGPELIAKLSATSVRWELRDTTWTIPGLLDDAAVRVIHIPNPFGPKQD